MLKLCVEIIESEIGPLSLITTPSSICALEFGPPTARSRARLAERFPGAPLITGRDACGLGLRLRAYLGGELRALEGAPLDAGGSPFQRQVWAALSRIPVGTTESYGALAARLGHPKAARAVGLANNRNPIPIAVPCHRVIGADGRLTGYGGGLPIKRWLLAHEGASLLA